MNATRLLITFALLFATYSLLVFVSYRPFTRPEGVRLSQSTTPIAPTTEEDWPRGDRSLIVRPQHRFGTTRKSFLMHAAFGYIALSVGFAIAFVVASRLA